MHLTQKTNQLFLHLLVDITVAGKGFQFIVDESGQLG
jgi:hypothetical protein